MSAEGKTRKPAQPRHHMFPKIGRFDEKMQEETSRILGGRPVAFRGTVKLHGTNTAIVQTSAGTVYGQGRSFVLSEKFPGVARFADFISRDAERATALRSIFAAVHQEVDRQWGSEGRQLTIVYYGEWCGPRIQKGVAISAMKHPAFFGFALKAVDEATGEEHWLDLEEMGERVESPAHRVYNITRFPGATCRVVVDPANLPAAEQSFQKLAAEVEARCPVAAALGYSGKGEGWVFCAEEQLRQHPPCPCPTLMFKAKGASFQDTKEADTAGGKGEGKRDRFRDFVARTVTDVRLRKGIDRLREAAEGGRVVWTMKDHVQPLIQWVTDDVKEEEAEEWREVVTSGSEDDLKRAIGKVVSTWFRQQLGALNKEEQEA